MSKINVVRIHNELLGTYGDRGNAEVLEFRGRYLGITVEIIDISYEDSLPTNGDIYLLGGAEDAAQILSREALAKDLETINLVLERGAVFLAVCAGFQILGNTFYADGKEQKGLGLLDVDSIPGKKRFVGDVKSKYQDLDLQLTGFENHAGETILSGDVKPLGKIEVGNGNGDGKFDGAIRADERECGEHHRGQRSIQRETGKLSKARWVRRLLLSGFIRGGAPWRK